MKLEVENSNGIVYSAFVKDSGLSFSLFINTRERHVDFDSTCSGDGFIEFWFDTPNMFADDDKIEADIVKLTAEDEKDKEILRRFRFELHDKDQIWILFPHKEII